MNTLSTQKCVPCEGGVDPMNRTEIEKYRGVLSQKWELKDDKRITYTFKFKTFKDSMEFVNRVAAVAEEEGHHPDIHIFYNKVTIELWTHAIGGLSMNDFIMAAKIENLPM